MKKFIILPVLAICISIACSAPIAITPTSIPMPANTSIPLPTDTIVPTKTLQVELPTPVPSPEVTMPFTLTSSAFTQGQSIPVKYSCKGENISPALAWNEPPAGTQSFALIMDDPDAPMGTWVHWIVIDIPAEGRALPEDMPRGMKFGDAAALFGKNSWGKNAYGGPCPPSGTHRYFFNLYALDTVLNLQEGVSKADLISAMQGHILAQAELMGTFSK